jgi:copper oxidase (laccase) domain-containing protein
MTEKLIPTESHLLFGGAVEVHCFGTRHGNWSMAGKTPEEAEKNNPGIMARMRQASEQFDCVILAPNPSRFNARIVDEESVNREWIEGRLYRGPLADGVRLRRTNAAFGVASADCPTLILRDRERGSIVAAHAGRDSLIKPPDYHNGLVGVMLGDLGLEPYEREEVRAFIACGIHSRHFTHPWRDGDRNYAMHRIAASLSAADEEDEEGGIDLNAVISGQLYVHGAHHSRVGSDSSDTYSDRGRDGSPLWFSNRRDKDGQRNFVLVIRRD